MDKIIITVDLGHFKAYRVSKNPMESAKTKLIESYDSIEGHGRLGNKLSDGAGRFGTGGGKNGAPKGYGEPHNLLIENEKKLAKMIANDINALIAREGYVRWYLAAARKINRQIIENLTPSVKARLVKNITADLTKINKSEILSYFA